MAEMRTATGGRDAGPYAIHVSGPRRRPAMLTAYGWAAVCALMALTLMGVALTLH